MSSLKYPQGFQGAAWQPQTLSVSSPSATDLYGRVISTLESVTVKGKINYRTIELIEAGARVAKQGAAIELSDHQDMDIQVGSIISDGTKAFTVVGYRAKADHQGNIHYWMCDCLIKATDQ